MGVLGSLLLSALQGMARHVIGWLAKVTLPFFFSLAAAVALIWLSPASSLRCHGRWAKPVGRGPQQRKRRDDSPAAGRWVI